ncbi:DUF4153 domain-containing protein [Rhodovulum tesquicola]|uniref:DUF4153 domain-containing protein n=1 Tax=Rhodovulum tesquicola TaxID=540254 RepID=UPI002097EBB9|nr:DUF4153 domain-containing protein [Rhodovulum tesquicola]MCO8144228.1 DUF4153 domain-containing protein [Rhodovulum tesquicola]
MDGVRAALVSGRVRLGLLGLLAGMSAWLLVDVLPDRMAGLPRLHLFVTSLGAAFFPAALALSGPLPPRRALAAAGLVALPLAGLMAWASLRFDDVAGFLATGHPWIGLALLLGLALPFLIAGLGPGRRPTDYAVLFTQSWMIVVRFAAAWLFVGLVWGVLFLSNALLGLVGIDVIERLMNRAEMPYLLSGLMLGLALAVVDELSDYVSPELVLQLLRLLLPVVLVVVAVFLAALPFRGLSNLFGDFSAAAILLAMAFGSATLVSSGLDASDERRAPGGLTWWCCRFLALLLPALAALAGVAVWLRVAQYGLTPDRVVAGAMAALALGYGLAYAGSVLAGPGWGARIRRANVGMALVAMAMVAGFFTPALDPQRLAVAHQIARFESGRVGAEGLDLWAIGREWGRAGQAGLARLAGMEDHPEAARLAERLAALENAETPYAFERQGESGDVAQLVADLAGMLPVRPEGRALPEGLLSSLRLWELQQIGRACTYRTAGGNPGCVAVLADLSGARAGEEVLIVAHNPAGALLVRAYFREAEGVGFTMRSPEFLTGADFYRAADAAIDALVAGEFRLVPQRLNALEVEGRTLFFGR